MKKPISILDTAAYVEPYTFETVGEGNLFQSYVEHLEFIFHIITFRINLTKQL